MINDLNPRRESYEPESFSSMSGTNTSTAHTRAAAAKKTIPVEEKLTQL